jgi:hypothetical protein
MFKCLRIRILVPSTLAFTPQEDVAKAGGKERTLYRNMRKLESETRKQEQICNSKKALMESTSTAARKQAQDQLRAVNSQQKEV